MISTKVLLCLIVYIQYHVVLSIKIPPTYHTALPLKDEFKTDTSTSVVFSYVLPNNLPEEDNANLNKDLNVLKISDDNDSALLKKPIIVVPILSEYLKAPEINALYPESLTFNNNNDLQSTKTTHKKRSPYFVKLRSMDTGEIIYGKYTAN